MKIWWLNQNRESYQLKKVIGILLEIKIINFIEKGIFNKLRYWRFKNLFSL